MRSRTHSHLVPRSYGYECARQLAAAGHVNQVAAQVPQRPAQNHRLVHVPGRAVQGAGPVCVCVWGGGAEVYYIPNPVKQGQEEG